MKKLKVILPAILTLAVSTSAAVTGTVAWFTATRLRTVEMNNIAVVDPEEGLNLELVEGIKGVIVDDTTVNSSTHVPLPSKTPAIKQAQYLVNSTPEQGYFRDGSVDLSQATPKVYKADIKDDGTYNTYSEVTTPDFSDANGKTYDDKKVFHATQFKLTFSVDTYSSEVYDQCLFLDLKQSSITLPEEDADGNDFEVGQNDIDLYKAIRFGFKTSQDWFVWAPNTDEATVAENQYLKSGTPTAYQTGELAIGDAGAVATPNTALVEDTSTGYITSNSETGTGNYYIGYLGKLAEYDTTDDEKNGTEVNVYTWFEGCDDDCISEKFSEVLQAMTVNLKFVMRKVAR